MSEKNFKVGDIVIGNFDDLKGVVTRVDEGGNAYILWPDGSCGWHDGDGLVYKKTGDFLDIEQCILSKLRSCE